MQIIGVQESNFKPKDSDAEIIGTTLYLTEQRKKVTGLACERVFISQTKLNGYRPEIGDEVRLYYNKYGKVEEIELEK